MKKRILLVSALALLLINAIGLSLNSNLSADQGRVIEGLLGKHNGIPICHCPDDAHTCECELSD